jgi:hypothetical protein
MAATTAGPEFEEALRPILEAAGPLPHGRLQAAMGASSHSNRRKKQHSRQIKYACSNCGYTVHTTRKWLELAGAPLCPKHGQMDTEKMQSPTTSITASALVRVLSGTNREHRRLTCNRRDFVTDYSRGDLAGTLTFTAPFNVDSQ